MLYRVYTISGLSMTSFALAPGPTSTWRLPLLRYDFHVCITCSRVHGLSLATFCRYASRSNFGSSGFVITGFQICQ